jgi:hypothetical protein
MPYIQRNITHSDFMTQNFFFIKSDLTCPLSLSFSLTRFHLCRLFGCAYFSVLASDIRKNVICHERDFLPMAGLIKCYILLRSEYDLSTSSFTSNESFSPHFFPRFCATTLSLLLSCHSEEEKSCIHDNCYVIRS